MAKILITGAAGYIGSLLCRVLGDDHHIVAVDNLMYSQGVLTYDALRNTNFYRCDVDNLPGHVWDDADIIIPLAGYVGMPSCKKHYSESTRVNLNNVEKIVDKARDDQVILFPNTNSGYGNVKEGICTEETPLNAISHYGKLKDQAEQVVMSHPNAVAFRLATVFGVSPRHRIDLLVNTLVYESYFNTCMDLFDNGFRRNYVHVYDIARVFDFAIKNIDKMKGEVYNVGNDKLNTTKQGIAEIIQKFFPSTKINLIDRTDPDQRDYIVSSEKIAKLGFQAHYDFKYGINELSNYYSRMPNNTHQREKLTRLMRNDQ